MTCRLLALFVLLAFGCAAPPESPEVPADGIYEVLAVAEDPADLPAPGTGTRIVVHDRTYVRGGAELPAAYVLVRLAGFAPLDLAEPPTPAEANGRPALQVTLTPESGRALTALTSHAERAAVVVDGAAVTVHRVRVPIEGGRLQVSC